MTDKYLNKYRIPSARLKNWNYRNKGAYFITICTHNKQRFFGNVFQREMKLSKIGKIANDFWKEIPHHFPHIILDAFIIMPDHMHGILIINKNINTSSKIGDEIGDNYVQTLQCNVCIRISQNLKMGKISPIPGSISTIIRSYKSITTKHARKIDANFSWQPRFHDHIIRDTKSFKNIHHYIKNNPKKWWDNKFY